MIFSSKTAVLPNDRPGMEKNRKEITNRILNFTFEIIYLLTGEDYTIVKKASCDGVTASSYVHEPGGRSSTQCPITRTPQHTLNHDRNNDQQILELINKIIELLSGEVPIRCQDVSVYFSMEEWEYLEGHKDLYKDIKLEHYQCLTSQDGSSRINLPDECPSPLHFQSYPEEYHNDQKNHKGEDLTNIKAEVEIVDERMKDEQLSIIKMEEEMSVAPPTDGYRRIQTPDTWPSPLHLQGYPEEYHSLQRNPQGEDPTNIKVEIVGGEARTRSHQQCTSNAEEEFSEDATTDGYRRTHSPDTWPSPPHFQGYPEEYHSGQRNHQDEDVTDNKVEVVGAEERMRREQLFRIKVEEDMSEDATTASQSMTQKRRTPFSQAEVYDIVKFLDMNGYDKPQGKLKYKIKTALLEELSQILYMKYGHLYTRRQIQKRFSDLKVRDRRTLARIRQKIALYDEFSSNGNHQGDPIERRFRAGALLIESMSKDVDVTEMSSTISLVENVEGQTKTPPLEAVPHNMPASAFMTSVQKVDCSSRTRMTNEQITQELKILHAKVSQSMMQKRSTPFSQDEVYDIVKYLDMNGYDTPQAKLRHKIKTTLLEEISQILYMKYGHLYTRRQIQKRFSDLKGRDKKTLEWIRRQITLYNDLSLNEKHQGGGDENPSNGDTDVNETPDTPMIENDEDHTRTFHLETILHTEPASEFVTRVQKVDCNYPEFMTNSQISHKLKIENFASKS